MTRRVEIDVVQVASGLLTGIARARITEAQLLDVLDAIDSDELKMAVVEEWVRRQETTMRAQAAAAELLKDLGKVPRKNP